MDNPNTKDNEIKLNTELDNCQKQAQEYLDNWKRERADFLNYKKEEAKRVREFVEFANEGVFLEVMDILDNMEVAMKRVSENLRENHKEWLEGLNKALTGFDELLKRYGIEKIKTEGQKFDPALHEAVNQEESPPRRSSSETNEEIEEVRAGYTMHGKVIRPARVKIRTKN